MQFTVEQPAVLPGPQRLMARCEELAQISSSNDSLCRMYLTDEHRRCNARVATWLQQAGLTPRVDAAGNLWGHLPGPTSDAPVLLLGSHLDTVANAGKYDGMLGVLAAIELVEQLQLDGIRLPFGIDVVGFADEEGTRFGATLLGSRAVTGRWQSQWFELQDAQGISLRQAMQEFGLNPDAVACADRSGDRLLAYLELHIEQGPVLEQAGQPVGVVTAIVGARRLLVTVEGLAGHAGTVPMALRRDALAGAAEAIGKVEYIAKSLEVVATVGKLSCSPGAINVIPGHCEFSLDVRSGRDEQRDQAVDKILAEITAVCEHRGLTFTWREIHTASAAKCASRLQRLAEDVIGSQGLESISLASGAGHDAMVFDGVTDMGMLFVRCAGGISHHPAETVTVEDVCAAMNVFYQLVVQLPTALPTDAVELTTYC